MVAREHTHTSTHTNELKRDRFQNPQVLQGGTKEWFGRTGFGKVRKEGKEFLGRRCGRVCSSIR